jgi:hypothetical protein
MRRGSLFWGFILVVAGMVWLLDTTGLLGNLNAWDLMWPLFLIGLGVWILVGRAFRRAPQTEHVVSPLEGAARARIKLQHGAGRLRLYGGAGFSNLFEGDFGGGLDVIKHRDGDLLDIKMSVPVQFFPFDWGPGWLDWSFGVNKDIPISLDVNTGASESLIDLTELRVSDLRLQTGASSTELILPANAGQTRIAVEAGAASVSVRVPSGVAGRIRARGGLTSIDVDASRFPRQGDGYQSPDYDVASNKVDIDIQAGVGAVNIR